MHKWKLFKKSAALVLSSAVIASGVPVTAMASEAEVFSDVSGETQGETAQEEGENEDQESVSQDQPEVGEADIQSEEPEESDAEAIQEEVAEISAEEIQQEEEEQIQEDTKEVFGDGEAFMAEAGEVLQDASEITVAGVKYLWSMQPAEGYTQIGTTGVYVKAADGQTALTGKLYGTTTLSYSEFYAGDTTQESYDAITSATTSKNQIFTNEDSTEVTSSGYQIQGVKNVSVAVDAETYVDAQVLKAASKLPKKGVYTEAADITLNEAPSQETGQYKTLNTDGTYSATKFDVKATVTDASAQIQAPSIWGDYMLVVKEVGILLFDIGITPFFIEKLTSLISCAIQHNAERRTHVRIPEMVFIPCSDIVAVYSQCPELCSVVKIDLIYGRVIGKDQHVMLFCFRTIQHRYRLLTSTDPVVSTVIDNRQDTFRDLNGAVDRIDRKLTCSEEHLC